MAHSIPLTLGMSLVLLAVDVSISAEETREVKVGAITIKVPPSWQQQPPSNNLRLTQFVVPPVDGDKEPAELSVFAFGPGGSVKAQVDRWLGQFQAAGRKYKGTTGTSPHGEYAYVELSGTYMSGPPRGKKTPMPGARMLIAMIAVKNNGNYFFKLVGQNKTIRKNGEAFRTAFSLSDEEKPLDLKQ